MAVVSVVGNILAVMAELNPESWCPCPNETPTAMLTTSLANRNNALGICGTSGVMGASQRRTSCGGAVAQRAQSVTNLCHIIPMVAKVKQLKQTPSHAKKGE